VAVDDDGDARWSCQMLKTGDAEVEKDAGDKKGESRVEIWSDGRNCSAVCGGHCFEDSWNAGAHGSWRGVDFRGDVNVKSLKVALVDH